FEERMGDTPLSHYMEEFYEEIQQRHVDLEIFEASGTLIPERISKLSLREFDPAKFPASRGATNIFLVGHAVYFALYKHSQIGLKIQQSEMSQIFHFLFDFVERKAGG
ncbi:hypothetical protein HZA41_02390, partial [Candidatus Peregrinibacteria bacterium]|nr:hypothetical protein [Candidatus Peregrinibacteria bacterium]